MYLVILGMCIFMKKDLNYFKRIKIVLKLLWKSSKTLFYTFQLVLLEKMYGLTSYSIGNACYPLPIGK